MVNELVRLRLKEYRSEYERGIKREREREKEGYLHSKCLKSKKKIFFSFLLLLLLLTKTIDQIFIYFLWDNRITVFLSISQPVIGTDHYFNTFPLAIT